MVSVMDVRGEKGGLVCDGYGPCVCVIKKIKIGEGGFLNCCC